MISKSIRPLVYGVFAFILSINDIIYKDVSFWGLLALLAIMDISHALDD